jgi:hypothetical protein
MCNRQIGAASLILQAFLLLVSPAAARAGGAATQPFVLHLPGVAGFAAVDRRLISGLIAGGVHADIQAYDWTGQLKGVPALHAYAHNHAEAARIAAIIAARARAYPNGHIILTSHSGGGALAIWALEDLPSGVNVNAVLLLAPALSPDYDLSAALKHISGHLYVYSSTGDELILGLGCRICGTMDGKMTDAAGRVGFTQPPGADSSEYKKLVACPYNPDWAWLGNFGDHIGPMATPFAARILAPLVTESAAAP